MTVNELMVTVKVIKERVSDLKSLREKTSVTERYYTATEKVVEPQYDIRILDRKVTELQNFLIKADAAIKQSNAKTEIDFKVDVDVLLKPLE